MYAARFKQHLGNLVKLQASAASQADPCSWVSALKLISHIALGRLIGDLDGSALKYVWEYREVDDGTKNLPRHMNVFGLVIIEVGERDSIFSSDRLS